MTTAARIKRDQRHNSCVSVRGHGGRGVPAAGMSLLRLCAPARILVLPKSLAAESIFKGCSRASSGAVKDKAPLKKAKTPQGRFDGSEEASQAALKKFPDDVNPETKEKGGPRGPEPTRYGDWERKGRCVDF
ncbi:succinate dehydrogenase assembly factor 4, mitochondrial [Spinachia spinachia]